MAHHDEREVRSLGARAALAPHDRDPNHHLWRNGRLWWIAFTAHRGCRQERIRLSLHTEDLGLARERRDALLDRIASAKGLSLSLRFVPQRDGRLAAQCSQQTRA